MKVRFLLLFLLVYGYASAQSLTDDNFKYIPRVDLPKSPNAGAFEKYTSLPGNYQTGQVSPTIPLMSFEIDGLNFPLTLNYSNTGLKVADVASWVGLGWNMTVGGIIVQQVNGIPDDCDLGLMNAFQVSQLESVIKNELTGYAKWDYFNKAMTSAADTEHDIFTYDVLGIQGKFYIDKWGKCIQLPNTHNKISYTLKPNKELESFTIIDERGNSYYFTIKENSTATSVNVSASPNLPNYYDKLTSSSWYLSEIKTVNDESIYFEYDNYSYNRGDISEIKEFNPNDCDGLMQGEPTITTLLTSHVDVYQLKSVRWKNGYLEFTKGDNRLDLKQIDNAANIPYLAGISKYETPASLSGGMGNLIQKVSLEYLNSSRLFLKGVGFGMLNIPEQRYEMRYINENSTEFPAYKFPQRGYTARDYWGYYNGANENFGLLALDAIPSKPKTNVSTHGSQIYIAPNVIRNNRSSNPTYSEYGMLKELLYPTGGKSVFYYEGNMVKKNAIVHSSGNSQSLVNTLIHSEGSDYDTLVTLGGVRIKRIQFYNDNSNIPATTTEIKYDMGKFYTGFMPLYYTYLYRYIYESVGCHTSSLYSFTVSSQSVVNNPAPTIQYNSVQEYNGASKDQGFVAYEFNPSPLGMGGHAGAPYINALYSNWLGGVNSVSRYDSNNKQLSISKTDFVTNNLPNLSIGDNLNRYGYDIKISLARNDTYRTYPSPVDPNPADFNVVYGMVHSPGTAEEAGEMANEMFKWEYSALLPDNYVTKSVADTTYDGVTPVGTIVNYHYHNQQRNLLLPNSISKINSRGDSLITLMTYPEDYFSSNINLSYVSPDQKVNGMLDLVRKNLRATPIEKISIVTRDGVRYVTGAILTTFKTFKPAISFVYKASFSHPIPLSAFTRSYVDSNTGYLVYDSSYRLEMSYDSYNNCNQPLQISNEKTGETRALIWDYNSTHQIADVTNASQSQIAYSSFEAQGTGNWIAFSAERRDTGFSGDKSYPLSEVNTLTCSNLNLENRYVVSYWTKGNMALNIIGTVYGPVKGVTLNGWTYYEHLLTGVAIATLKSSQETLIDEVRLHPEDAQMTTYTYRPLVGMTSMVNSKNQITHYVYDEMLRLYTVKDQNGNVIERTDYHYADH